MYSGEAMMRKTKKSDCRIMKFLDPHPMNSRRDLLRVLEVSRALCPDNSGGLKESPLLKNGV
jgi:hypothetical protein